MFRDDEDYENFLGWLKRYVLSVNPEVASGYKAGRPYRIRHMQDMNLTGVVEVWAYCLMPDHFHLLVRQYREKGIAELMRRMLTGFVMDYNRKYKRRGMLWDGVYRAALVEEGEVLEATRRIHLNPVTRMVRRFGPVETVTGSRPGEYLYSSYKDYINSDYDGWIKTYRVLELAGGREKYKELVEMGKSKGGKFEWEMD